MSYEGHTLAICQNGHRFSWDAMEDYCGYGDEQDNPKLCPDCKTEAQWWTNVDETNGVDEETGHCPGYVELEVDKEATFEECPCCKHKKLLTERTFKVPPDKGCVTYKGFTIAQESSLSPDKQRQVIDKILTLGYSGHYPDSYFGSEEVMLKVVPKLVENRKEEVFGDFYQILQREPDRITAQIPIEMFLKISTMKELCDQIKQLPSKSFSAEYGYLSEEEDEKIRIAWGC